MLTDTDWLLDSPSTIVLILKDCDPAILGLKITVTSVNSPPSIETVCGVTLTRSAHDSKSDTEITKSLSSPLFVTSALTIKSVPTSAGDSRFALTDGSGPRQDRISNVIEASLSMSFEFSSYDALSNSSSSSSYAKNV